MTEYEKKLEELRGICEWLQEHGDEVDEQDGAVIIAFENPEAHFSACLMASGHLLKLTALHMAILKCMEKNADEDDRVETKAGSFGVYAKREEDVEKLQAALEKLIEQEQEEKK